MQKMCWFLIEIASSYRYLEYTIEGINKFLKTGAQSISTISFFYAFPYLFNLRDIHLSGSPFLRRITLPILDLDFSFVVWDCSLSSSIFRSWNSNSLIFLFTFTPVYLCRRRWLFKITSSVRLFEGFFNFEWTGYSLTFNFLYLPSD